MNIEDIKGKRVTVSAHTITVKDNDDKTRGLIRNIDNLYALQTNKQFEYHSRLKKSGLPREVYMGQLKYILICNEKMYYLCDDYSYDVSKRVDDGYYKRVDEFESSGVINVIHCQRVKH